MTKGDSTGNVVYAFLMLVITLGLGLGLGDTGRDR